MKVHALTARRLAGHVLRVDVRAIANRAVLEDQVATAHAAHLGDGGKVRIARSPDQPSQWTRGGEEPDRPPSAGTYAFLLRSITRRMVDQFHFSPPAGDGTEASSSHVAIAW